jgi:hypothetical protein
MSSDVLDRVHPVVDFAHRLDSRLDDLAHTPVWSLSPAEQCEALEVLARDQAKLDALKLRLLTEADRSGATTAHGDGTAADWLSRETRQTRRQVRADLRLGKRLEKYAALSTALDTGAVNTAQARVIVTALDRLPKTGEFALSTEQLLEAERLLVDQAAHFDPDKLQTLGWRVFEVIAPELAEQWEGRTLAAQEAKALRKADFGMWEDHEGICHGKFRIPHLHGEMLKKLLGAFTNLDRPDGATIDPDLPTATRNGLALIELIESITDKQAPKTGGTGATIVVTMTLEQLLAALEAAGVCTLDTGGRISAGEARRLACTAGLIPVVLGGKSQPLDVGRKKRFHTPAMRAAMALRDGGCTTEDCDKPPSMTIAHHDHPWSKGGSTNTETGRLLCPHHHRCVHDPTYRTEHLPNGKITFHRRT